MSDDRLVIHVRLPKRLIKLTDHMSIVWDLDRGRTVERLLEEALATHIPELVAAMPSWTRQRWAEEFGIELPR